MYPMQDWLTTAGHSILGQNLIAQSTTRHVCNRQGNMYKVATYSGYNTFMLFACILWAYTANKAP